MIRIRLIGTAVPEGFYHPLLTFDTDIPISVADGLLCWGSGRRELVEFRGPKAWYYPEPRRFSARRAAHFAYYRARLSRSEFLHHSNSNPEYALPVVTHYGDPSPLIEGRVGDGVAAVVSNFGGQLWWLNRGARLRNALITHPAVQLYGSPQSWCSFRASPFSTPKLPANYRGAWMDGKSAWYFNDHVEHLSQFRAVICLENCFERDYFTEKFVNACRANCVPIYRAHPTVRSSVLKGAAWIDPEDYDFDIDKTLMAALECDASAIISQNRFWLNSGALASSEGGQIWRRIAGLFVRNGFHNA